MRAAGDRDAVAAGAAAYRPWLLGVYNVVVVHFSNTVLWRCSRRVMLRQYQAHLGARHLDLGPGTGWYLDRAGVALQSLTLLDLNPNSLARASTVLRRFTPVCETGSVLDPLPEQVHNLDSVAANFLFHCVPGDWQDKGRCFSEIGGRLAPGGVFFGASILDSVPDARGGPAARTVMRVYQRLGIFHNAADTIDDLRLVLDEHFAVSTVEVVGSVALFHASQPRVREMKDEK